jgi:cytochrome c oxidase cbb3-type subunit 3
MNKEANIFLNCLLGLALILILGMSAALEAADAEQGRLLYRENCAQCHGLEGSGKGINAPHLEVAPRNHTDYEEMNARTNEELFKAISDGGQAVNKSVLMPNWGYTLSEQDINDLIAFLRKLCCEQ